MNKNPDGLAGKTDETTRLVKTLESADIERRLSGVEGHITTLESHLLDRHAKLITIIFSCMAAFVAVCAILVTVLGISSKNDTREATREMDAKVEKAISDMRQQVAAFTGEALKKATLKILSTNDTPFDGHVFEASSPMVDLGPIFLRNVGEKRSDTISVRLYSSVDLNLFFGSSAWDPVINDDRDYKSSWYLILRPTTVDPSDTIPVESSLKFQFASPLTNVNFKLRVSYGTTPTEAKFLVKMKP